MPARASLACEHEHDPDHAESRHSRHCKPVRFARYRIVSDPHRALRQEHLSPFQPAARRRRRLIRARSADRGGCRSCSTGRRCWSRPASNALIGPRARPVALTPGAAHASIKSCVLTTNTSFSFVSPWMRSAASDVTTICRDRWKKAAQWPRSRMRLFAGPRGGPPHRGQNRARSRVLNGATYAGTGSSLPTATSIALRSVSSNSAQMDSYSSARSSIGPVIARCVSGS